MEAKPDNDSLYITMKTAAKLIGCGVDTIRRAVQNKELRAVNLGQGTKKGTIFIRRESLFEWLARREEEGVQDNNWTLSRTN